MTNFLNDLPQNVQALAERGNWLDPRDVCTTAIAQFISGGCSEKDAKLLKAAAAKWLAPQLLTAKQLLSPPWACKWSRISFGCKALDECLSGGVLTRGITEICGVSGVGKTQLLLQLSLTVQWPTERGGLSKGCAYICTEDVFPSKRLYQIAEAFERRFPDQPCINYLGRIYIEHVLEGEDLLKCVTQRLTKLMESVSIGLIVIDSVAAIYRLYTNYIARAREMRKLAHQLLYLTDKYHCAVVCVNQMTSPAGSKRDVPCLGLAWAHLGRTRIRISKVPKEFKVRDKLLTARRFEILYCPEASTNAAEFLITEDGVVDIKSALNSQQK